MRLLKFAKKAAKRGHNTMSPIFSKKRGGRKGAEPMAGKKGKNKAAKPAVQ